MDPSPATEDRQHEPAPPASCRLLSLPAELRNRIYELAFAHDSEKDVDLLKAQTPSKDLVLTCRAIYAEASGVYKQAYRDFWTTSRFQMQMQQKETDAIAKLQALADADLDHIRTISIGSALSPSSPHSRYEGGEIWAIEEKDSRTVLYVTPRLDEGVEHGRGVLSGRSSKKELERWIAEEGSTPMKVQLLCFLYFD